MEKLALAGLLVGYVWGTAGVVGYPRVAWLPGAVLTVASLIWLVAHRAMPAEPLIEAVAIGIFLVLWIARDRLFPPKPEAPVKPDAPLKPEVPARFTGTE